MLASIVLITMPMTFGQLVEEGLVGRVEAFQRGQLEHAAHLALEDDGQHQHVHARATLAQAGRDAEGAARHD